jgi:fumarate reductase (CoM/CoB) subunit B
MKRINVKIYRYNPDTDKKPKFKTYNVKVHEGARVLDVLHTIHSELDATLSYSDECNAGQCGICAVKVNGVPVLACKEEAQDKIIIEPIALPVKKDLVVAISPLFKTITSFKPNDKAQILAPQTVAALEPLRKCIQCFACNSVCPTMSITDFAGPAAMCQEMRIMLDPRGKNRNIKATVAAGVFKCTSCKVCWHVCPKEIKIFTHAIEKLRAKAHQQGFSLASHLEFGKRIRETKRSVVSMVTTTFLDAMPEVVDAYGKVKATIGLFVGCLYNSVIPQAAFDLVKVFTRNGIKVIIAKDQVCCASPLIRTGQLAQVAELQQQNIAAFAAYNIDALVTMCSGCGMTWQEDYSALPFKVMDANEFLVQYEIESPARLPFNLVYHDPCHSIYGQGIKDQPRVLLRKIADVIEMPHLCCGAGGGMKIGMPEIAKKIVQTLGANIVKTKADVVATACPFCEFHLSENLTFIPIKNVFTLLWEGYQLKDKQSF